MNQDPKAAKDPFATKFWFELRFAAEKASEAFKNFSEAMEEGVRNEKERLAQSRQAAKLRATEMEADYQAWRAEKIKSSTPDTSPKVPKVNTSTMCVCGENQRLSDDPASGNAFDPHMNYKTMKPCPGFPYPQADS